MKIIGVVIYCICYAVVYGSSFVDTRISCTSRRVYWEYNLDSELVFGIFLVVVYVGFTYHQMEYYLMIVHYVSYHNTYAGPVCICTIHLYYCRYVVSYLSHVLIWIRTHRYVSYVPIFYLGLVDVILTLSKYTTLTSTWRHIWRLC